MFVKGRLCTGYDAKMDGVPISDAVGREDAEMDTLRRGDCHGELIVTWIQWIQQKGWVSRGSA